MKNLLYLGVLALVLLTQSCKSEKEVQPKSSGNAGLDQLTEMLLKDSLNTRLYFDRANIFYQNESYDGAISDLTKAISIDSLVPEFYHFLSDVYMDYYRSKDALLTMEECVRIFPKRIPSLLKLSETELILKQYENSLNTCSKILSINDQNAEAYFMMGLNLKSLPDMERAKVAFRKATELDPELVDAWIILGQIFEDEKNPKALEYFEAATNIDSENPSTWHSKAFYLQNNSRENEALEIYRKINVIDKNYLDAYLNAGILYLSMDSIDQAYDQFNIMINIKPLSFIAHYYRGISNELKGQLENAKQDYQTSLRLNSKFDKARKALNALESKEQSN